MEFDFFCFIGSFIKHSILVLMKKYLLIVLALVGVFFAFSPFHESTVVVISPESQLFIEGKTNVNQFSCNFDIDQIDKPIPVKFKPHNDILIFDNANLVLSNHCFDCGHKGINNDFRALLKTDQYPKITLTLLEIEQPWNSEAELEAKIKLNIAGKTNTYHINLKHTSGNTETFVNGKLKLNIKDFNIEPPKKMLGLVVVNEMIEINFQLVLKKA